MIHQPDTLWLCSTGTGTLSNVVGTRWGWVIFPVLMFIVVCSVAHWDKPEVRDVQQTLFIPGHWQSGNPESHRGDKHWLSVARSQEPGHPVVSLPLPASPSPWPSPCAPWSPLPSPWPGPTPPRVSPAWWTRYSGRIQIYTKISIPVSKWTFWNANYWVLFAIVYVCL